MIVKISLTKL